MRHSFTNAGLQQRTLDDCYFPIDIKHLDTINELDIIDIVSIQEDENTIEHYIYLDNNELANYIVIERNK